jgi:hypothetical protein
MESVSQFLTLSPYVSVAFPNMYSDPNKVWQPQLGFQALEIQNEKGQILPGIKSGYFSLD